MVSEEEDEVVVFSKEFNKNVKYVVLMDLFDGFFNIDVNVLVGIIFLIYCCVLLVGILLM